MMKKLMALAACLLLFACNRTPDMPDNLPSKPENPEQNTGMHVANAAALWLNPGEKVNVELKFDREPAKKDLVFRVEDAKVATVSASGELSAVATGVTKIFVKNKAGKERAFAVVTVATKLPADATLTNGVLSKWPAGEIPADGRIIFPAGITEIGRGVFLDAGALHEVLLPPGLKLVNARAFMGSGLKKVDVPAGTMLGTSAFQKCNELEEVTMAAGSGFKAYQFLQFAQCPKLAKVSLPTDLRSLPSQVFKGCEALERIELPAGLEEMSERVFTDCHALKEIVLPESNKAFAVKDDVLFSKDMKKLILCPPGFEKESYEIPAGVLQLASAAFETQTHLATLTLGKDVNRIWRDAFGLDKEKSSLAKIISLNAPETIKISGFPRRFSYAGVLEVPAKYLEAYQESQYWSLAKIQAAK